MLICAKLHNYILESVDGFSTVYPPSDLDCSGHTKPALNQIILQDECDTDSITRRSRKDLEVSETRFRLTEELERQGIVRPSSSD